MTTDCVYCTKHQLSILKRMASGHWIIFFAAETRGFLAEPGDGDAAPISYRTFQAMMGLGVIRHARDYLAVNGHVLAEQWVISDRGMACAVRGAAA